MAREKIVRFQDDRIADFLDRVAGERPTLPAAGSVAALAGALAACLAEFVAVLSRRKEDRLGLKNRFQAMGGRLEKLRDQCLGLMDRDAEAYGDLMKAMRMPRGSRAERVLKDEVLNKAWIGALVPAVALAKCGLEVLRLSVELLGKGCAVARTDAGVAAEIAHGCVRSGLWIARSNMGEIRDEAVSAREGDLLDVIRAETEYLFERIKGEVG
jgi:formiminotetrahydrofolate cyclodeaminase